MGYTIVYDRLFLRAEDRYIPICLYGSNNCTEFINGREVLERSWDSFSYCDDMLLASAETLMREVRSRHEGKGKENFKFHGKWMDDASVVRFFENGIKRAVTIEELRRQYSGVASLHAYLSCWPKGDGWCKTVMDKYLRTTEEIIQWTEDAKAKKKEMQTSGDWGSVYLCFSFDTRSMIRVVPMVHSDKPVIAKSKYGYVVDVSPNRHGWSCSPDITKAIVFANSEEAYVSLPDEPFVLVSAESKKKAACKDWVLTVNRSGARVIIHKLAARRCHLTNFASQAEKRFSSSEEAIRWYEEKIRPRFPGLTDPVPQKLAEV